MSEELPPPKPPVRRPRRLTVALFVALLIGLAGAADGCRTVDYYRSERPRAIDNPALESFPTESDRKWFAEVEEAAMDAEDEARAQRFPLGVAEMLVGMLLAAVATRALGRRPGSQKLLVQLIMLHAALAVAANMGDRGIWAARAAKFEAMPESAMRALFRMEPASDKSAAADNKGLLTPDELAVTRTTFGNVARIAPKLHSTGSGLLALLVVSAILGTKSRAYFQSAASVASEI